MPTCWRIRTPGTSSRSRKQGFRPEIVVSERQYTRRPSCATSGTGCPSGRTEYWFVDGRLQPKNHNVGLDTTPEAREMRDVEARLRHMDELEVDVQVLYPTLFLRPVTMKPAVELALCRTYNRWLAGLCEGTKGRLRWIALVAVPDYGQGPGRAGPGQGRGRLRVHDARAGRRQAAYRPLLFLSAVRRGREARHARRASTRASPASPTRIMFPAHGRLPPLQAGGGGGLPFAHHGGDPCKVSGPSSSASSRSAPSGCPT